MSRVVVFDLNGASAGEFEARIPRGYSLTGNPNISPGGSTSATISIDLAARSWLQFGRLAVVRGNNLPDWAGMIDPDWAADGPVGLTLYNVEYLLSLRTPDDAVKLTGTTASIAGQMIDMINRQEETLLRLGETEPDVSREETLDERPFWDQLKAMIERAGMEMQIRPQVTAGRLTLYMDIRRQLGATTNFEYKDGQGGNMTVTGAKVSKQIWNRVIGYNDGSTKQSRLVTAPIVDETSRALYRLRSKKIQFRGVRDAATLRQNALTYLYANSWPTIELTVKIKDKGHAFSNAGRGNSAIFHASNVWLPGGRKGWRGVARMLAMAYDEPTNTLGMTVVGRL